MNKHDSAKASALCVSAFIDELIACGVNDVVISPGSRSTPLALIAYESDLCVHVDIDERGAAFFALGLAKASGKPVCVICTSGTAVANYYPAVCEAESSRIPLIILTGDRPAILQNLGAPQTCDQLHMFGDHVKHFQQMPLPGCDIKDIAFARQMALSAFMYAVGSAASTDDYGHCWYGCISDAGPVHINFPFEEPLLPNLELEELFTCGRKNETLENNLASQKTETSHTPQNDRAPQIAQLAQIVQAAQRRPSPVHLGHSYPEAQSIQAIQALLSKNRSLVLCGEGSFSNRIEAQMLLDWAHSYELPLIADPLSGLRSYEDPLVIDNYDNLFSAAEYAEVDLVIRFGRYPISKACFSALAKSRPTQIVVDIYETRDFNALSDLVIKSTPAAFVASFLYDEKSEGKVKNRFLLQTQFAQKWITGNAAAAKRIEKVREITQGFEGAFVDRLLHLAPKSSCIFSASSLSIRMLDTFYTKQNKDLKILCNRGLNGIDGTISSALGASLCFEQTSLLIGDLALLHDINALALQAEFFEQYGQAAPAIIVVVLNNKGGALFDMLPQRSDKAYFKRLFLTPQTFEMGSLAKGFGVEYACVSTTTEFEHAYINFLGKPGIHMIEIALDAEGLKERYATFLA